MRPLTLLGAALLLLAAGCSRAPAEQVPASHLHLTESDNGGSFTIDAGTEVMVVVPSNNAEFSWVVMNPATEVLTMPGKPVYIPPLDAAGAGTHTQVFVFDAVHSGSADLLLGYQDLKNPAVSPKLTYRVTIAVR